jgi:hypothetical protein
VIDVIRNIGKGNDFGVTRAFFDAKKQYDFVDRLSGGELKRLYLYRFNSESKLLDSR